jgi:hypothetical protein
LVGSGFIIIVGVFCAVSVRRVVLLQLKISNKKFTATKEEMIIVIVNSISIRVFFTLIENKYKVLVVKN